MGEPFITKDMMFTTKPRLDAKGIQLFLETIHCDWLARRIMENGQPFNVWLYELATSNGYEPLYWLAMLQKEQSLIQKKPESNDAFDWALGYGCPETGKRNVNYKGFEKQIVAAMHRYFDYDKEFSEVKNWGKARVRLFDSQRLLDQYNGGSKTMVAASHEDALNLVYNPRIEGLVNLSVIWKKYFNICKGLKLISE